MFIVHISDSVKDSTLKRELYYKNGHLHLKLDLGNECSSKKSGLPLSKVVFEFICNPFTKEDHYEQKNMEGCALNVRVSTNISAICVQGKENYDFGVHDVVSSTQKEQRDKPEEPKTEKTVAINKKIYNFQNNINCVITNPYDGFLFKFSSFLAARRVSFGLFWLKVYKSFGFSLGYFRAATRYCF